MQFGADSAAVLTTAVMPRLEMVNLNIDKLVFEFLASRKTQLMELLPFVTGRFRAVCLKACTSC